MKRSLGRLAALVAVATGGLASVATAQAGTLDQQQTTSGVDVTVASGLARAQTFTAGLTGKIDQVDLLLKQMNAPTQPLTVQIQATTGGLPNGTVLGSASLMPASVPAATEAFVPVVFPTASQASVTAGTQYAIVLSTTAPAPELYLWYGTGTSAYAAGAAYYNTGTGWLVDSNIADFAFKTYVAASTAVTFRSLSATAAPAGVLARWRTASELDTLGFHVYREVNGKRVRASGRLIASRGGAGGSYTFLDRRAPRRTSIRYWIQEVALDGTRRWYGPARVVRA